MNSNNIYPLLTSYIKTASNGRLLLFRGDEELAVLKRWLEEKSSAASDESLTGQKPQADESVASMISACEKCGNVYNRKTGRGSGDSGIMIILNMPGSIDRIEKKKLREESGDLLKKMMEAIKVNLEGCYITNMIKCETDDSFNRPGLMFRNCEYLLKREIAEIEPGIILVMGDDMPLTKIKHENTGIKWFKVDHPMKMIKDPSLKNQAWKTLQEMMLELK